MENTKKRFLIALLIILVTVGITYVAFKPSQYDMIKTEYMKGNEIARGLLSSGMSPKIANKLDKDILRQALKGDRRAAILLSFRIKSLQVEDGSYWRPPT